ncbi:MAG: hypothetical protein SP1CHLAM54_06260 [Chlamydiia bacterium]|nr:hypothetical protein [Chlamydiia bacterium]MCH9615536.1 hypothetical protein [Chlamydiia bacterium]MCH9629191.1 hypothetical protein [Chlamydiia bacterium]
MAASLPPINLGSSADTYSTPDADGWVRMGDYEVRLVMRHSDGTVNLDGVPKVPHIDRYARALIGALPDAQTALRNGKSILLNATTLSTKADTEQDYSAPTDHSAPSIPETHLPFTAKDHSSRDTAISGSSTTGILTSFADVWAHMLSSAKAKKPRPAPLSLSSTSASSPSPSPTSPGPRKRRTRRRHTPPALSTPPLSPESSFSIPSPRAGRAKPPGPALPQRKALKPEPIARRRHKEPQTHQSQPILGPTFERQAAPVVSRPAELPQVPFGARETDETLYSSSTPRSSPGFDGQSQRTFTPSPALLVRAHTDHTPSAASRRLLDLRSPMSTRASGFSGFFGRSKL